MGGSLGVTIREPNGKEHRMCRWTNALPWFVNNIRLLQKDPKHIKEYLREWYKMEADYEKHKDEWKAIERKHRDAWQSNPFKHNMTLCYAPYPFLAPQEYGLVVVDMVNNQIISYQDYCALGTIHAISIRCDMHENEDGLHTLFSTEKDERKLGKKAFFMNDNHAATRFREFYEAGRIKKATVYSKDKREVIDIGKKSLDDIINLIKQEDDLFFDLDISPFQVINYKAHDANDAKKMMARVLELGFTLSKKERRMWREWVEEEDRS